MNRKQILKICIFAGLFLWLLMTLTYIIRMNGDTKDRFAGFYAEKKDSLDAVIIGSSPVYACYASPLIYEETGACVYPLSSSMQLPAAGYYLTKEVLKTQKPELFIYELRMYTGQENDIEQNVAHIREVTDNMKYSLNRAEAVHELVDDEDERISYYFDIFKYHSNWRTLILPAQLKMWRYAASDIKKGYRADSAVGPGVEPSVADVEDVQPVQALQEQTLRKLLTFLDENGQKALFIVTPYDLDETDQAKYNYLKGIIDEYGQDYLNMNETLDEIGLDWSRDFADGGGHTNSAGSYKVSSFLAGYLEDHYDLADHRNDKAYSSWDKAFDEYEKTYQINLEKIEENIRNKNFSEHINEDE